MVEGVGYLKITLICYLHSPKCSFLICSSSVELGYIVLVVVCETLNGVVLGLNITTTGLTESVN